jgi:hypothetical protein
LGTAIGAALDPPPEEPRVRPLVTVVPLYHDQIEKGGVGFVAPRVPTNVSGFFFFGRKPNGRTEFFAAGGTDSALRTSLNTAVQYAGRLTALQKARAREIVRDRAGSPETLDAARELVRAGPLYATEYKVELPHSGGEGPARTGLLGLAVATVFLLGALPAVRLGGVLAWCVGPRISLAALLGALLFAGAAAYAIGGTTRELRVLLIAVVLVSPLRGALEGLLSIVDVPRGFLLVNLVQPALIGAGALAFLAWPREQRQSMHPGLVAGWIAIAAAAALDILTQTVGPTVYAIGLVQYLLYPTFALLLWQAMGKEDSHRFAELLILGALAVSISIGLEVIDLLKFPESVPGRSLPKPRYGGTTGSFIHAGILLGTTIPLAVGWAVSRRTRAGVALGVGAMIALIAGLALTLGRGGFVIAAIALVLLFIASGSKVRLRMLAIGVLAVAIALPVSFAAGRSPTSIVERGRTFTKPNQSVVNRGHWRVMRHALERYWDSPLPERLFGRGLAATGNAARVAGGVPDVTDNYLLKVLAETGIVGLLAIGAFLIWALSVFWRATFGSEDALLAAAGAAGLALSADFMLLPVLEIQVLSMVWWLLLATSLRSREAASP